MRIALIAPEFIVAFAMRQRINASYLREKYQGAFHSFFLNLGLNCRSLPINLERGWTRNHGFFAIMGGFMLYDGEKPLHTLDPFELESTSFDFPNITEGEINDRSKGDILSKGLVIIQTSWFILRCVARGVEGLPVTELELLTLAFAVLNFATYALWWGKPLNVQYPVRIQRISGGLEDEEEEVDEQGEESHQEGKGGMWKAVEDSMCNIAKIICNVPASIRRTIVKMREMDVDVIVNMMFTVFLQAVRGYGNSVDFKVPIFYSGTLRTRYGEERVFIASGLVGTIFGAIHCIAWSFQFPTRTEQFLWRVSSIVITCGPVLFLIANAIMRSVTSGIMRISVIILFVVTGLGYLVGRVTLFILVLISLRSLPSGAYQTVRWTTFIPHI